MIVGVKKAEHDAQAEVAGLISEINAVKEQIIMLEKKYEAEVITPAIAEKDKMILDAQARAARVKAKAQGEIDELKQTLEIIKKNGQLGKQTYLIENFKKLIAPFAETIDFFPVKKLSVITGIEGKHEPISAIHPNAVDQIKNQIIDEILNDSLKLKSKDKKDTKVTDIVKNIENQRK